MVAYKLFNTKKTQPGKLFPLYVFAQEEIPMNTWLDAKDGPRTENGKVKSKLGELAYRPGFHCSDLPLVTHIGIKGADGKIAYINPNHVWAEVEISDNIDYQEEAITNGYHNGKYNPRDADLEYIPVNGYYKYKTNPNMTGEWLICGSMKVNRILSDEEVKEICNTHGYEPLPRYGVA